MNMNGILIERNHAGYVSISTTIESRRVRKLYVGYTEEEALRLFLEGVDA